MNIRHIIATLSVIGLAASASAQAPFTSGSTGTDGPLNLTTNGTVTLDPTTLPAQCANNICNFTTINIGPTTTVVLTSPLWRATPVIWLATGTVTISGTIVLDGGAGPNLSTYGAEWIQYRIPTQPGPGGFPGGVGTRYGTPISPAQPGLGPGGAPVQTNPNCTNGGGGSFYALGNSTPAGSTYGNIQLTPLIGGSGGSGGCFPVSDTATDAAGGTGGAGGGAIRIVSALSIALPGRISAAGGSGGSGRSGGNSGGGGSGGAINLIAPMLTGNGSLFVGPGGGGAGGGGGYILLNATANSYTGSASGGLTTLRPLVAPPLPTPTTVPTVTIVSINNVSVPQPPAGAFQTPDVTINATTAVNINISAVGVPVGTQVQLNIQSELGADQNITCPALSALLTATCTALFPTSVSRILASASW